MNKRYEVMKNTAVERVHLAYFQSNHTSTRFRDNIYTLFVVNASIMTEKMKPRRRLHKNLNNAHFDEVTCAIHSLITDATLYRDCWKLFMLTIESRLRSHTGIKFRLKNSMNVELFNEQILPKDEPFLVTEHFGVCL